MTWLLGGNCCDTRHISKFQQPTPRVRVCAIYWNSIQCCGRHGSVQTGEINSRTWKSLVARGENKIEAKFQWLPPYYRCYPVHWKQGRCRGSHATARAGKSHSRTWKSLATRAGNEIEPQFQMLPHIIVIALYADASADVVGVTPLPELEKSTPGPGKAVLLGVRTR